MGTPAADELLSSRAVSDREPDRPSTVEDPALGDTVSASPRAAEAELAPGARLGERYTIVRLLGRGGMGAVYLATDAILRTQVALKLVLRERAGGAGGIEALRDEVTLAQTVTHHNVCRTFDVEEWNGRYVVKMEFVDGETLAERVSRTDRLSIEEALHVARGIAAGLAAAHARGVIHRDLKPQNVMLEERTGRVVLMDFGIARAMARPDDDGRPSGTPGYMVPEQARAERVDGRADLYALGCVLYHMLVGEVPFPASTPMAAVLRHLADPPPDPRAARPDLPAWLVKLVRRLLEKDPARRPSSALEVLRLLHGPPATARRVALGALAVAAVAAAVGLPLHRFLSVHERFCAGVVTRRQVMECSGPLGADALAGRSVAFRVLTRRGRTERVERVRDGHLAADDYGLATWEYLYDEAGPVKETVARDAEGHVRVRVIHAADLGRSERRDAHGDPLPEPGTDVTVERPSFDARGYLARVRYENVYGSPRADRRGAFGYEVTVDGEGRITALGCLGADGTPAPTPAGLARITIRRDGAGFPVEERALGADGGPVRTDEGWAVVRRRWDEHGNLVEEATFDGDGKPTVTAGGAASFRAVYDGSGDRVQLSFFGPDGAPALAAGGWAIVRTKYDRRGRPVEEGFFGVYGEPTFTRDGFAVRKTKYEVGAVEESIFDKENRAVATAGGWAKVRRELDGDGNVGREAFFDEDGRPTLTREGFSARRLSRDERGRVVEEALLGVDGRPTLHRDGWASRHLAYDERGQLVEERLLGVDGQPASHRDGWARRRFTRDGEGLSSETSYRDADDHPVLRRDGFSARRAVVDRRGRLVEETLFGPSGERVVGSEGWSQRRLGWGEGGEPIEEELLDAADRPVAGPEGWAVRRVKLDAGGREVEVRLLGAAGAPTVGRDGWAVRRTIWDGRDRVELAFLDADWRPAHRPGGARIVTSYDGHHRAQEGRRYDDAGRPLADGDGFFGTRWKTDPWGRVVEETGLGPDGKPRLGRGGWATVRTRWDDAGRAAQRDLLDGEGRLTIGRDGWASSVARHDRFGRRVEELWFGPDKHPVAGRTGAAGRATRFDDDGRELRHTDFDLRGEAIAGVGRDLDGRPVAWSLAGGKVELVGADGKPLRDPAALARLARRVEAWRRALSVEAMRARRPGLFRNARGVLVMDTGPKSLAHGFRPGDVILSLSRRRLERPLDVAAIAAGDAPAPVEVIRDGEGEVWQIPPRDLADLVLEPL